MAVFSSFLVETTACTSWNWTEGVMCWLDKPTSVSKKHFCIDEHASVYVRRIHCRHGTNSNGFKIQEENEQFLDKIYFELQYQHMNTNSPPLFRSRSDPSPMGRTTAGSFISLYPLFVHHHWIILLPILEYTIHSSTSMVLPTKLMELQILFSLQGYFILHAKLYFTVMNNVRYKFFLLL